MHKMVNGEKVELTPEEIAETEARWAAMEKETEQWRKEEAYRQGMPSHAAMAEAAFSVCRFLVEKDSSLLTAEMQSCITQINEAQKIRPSL